MVSYINIERIIPCSIVLLFTPFQFSRACRGIIGFPRRSKRLGDSLGELETYTVWPHVARNAEDTDQFVRLN